MDETKFRVESEALVTTFNEALDLADEKYSYQTAELPLSQLKVTQEGMLQVSGEERPTTKQGLVGLCKVLRIPDPFAERIPFDLLQHNIGCLIQESSSRHTLVHSRSTDGVILNTTRDHFKPIDNNEMLLRARALWPNEEDIRIKIGDRGLDIDVISFENDIKVARSSKVGDVVKAGVRITNSPTGLWATTGKFLLYVLRCTNGAILGKEWGETKMKLKPESLPEPIYNKFFAKLAEMQPNFNRLTSVLGNAGQTFLTDEEVFSTWKAIRKTLTTDEADELLGLSENERAPLVTEVRARLKKNSTTLGEPEPAKPTNVILYDVFDNITSYAISCQTPVRHSLEKLSGSLLYRQN